MEGESNLFWSLKELPTLRTGQPGGQRSRSVWVMSMPSRLTFLQLSRGSEAAELEGPSRSPAGRCPLAQVEWVKPPEVDRVRDEAVAKGTVPSGDTPPCSPTNTKMTKVWYMKNCSLDGGEGRLNSGNPLSSGGKARSRRNGVSRLMLASLADMSHWESSGTSLAATLG